MTEQERDIFAGRVKKSLNYEFDDRDATISELVAAAEAHLLSQTERTREEICGERESYPEDFSMALVALAAYWFLNPLAGSDRPGYMAPFYQATVSKYTKLTE